MTKATRRKRLNSAKAMKRWRQGTSAPAAAESGAEAPAAAGAAAAAAEAHAAVGLATSAEAPAIAATDASAAAAEGHAAVELGTPAEAVGTAVGGESARTTKPAGYPGRPKRACTNSDYEMRDWYVVQRVYSMYTVHHTNSLKPPILDSECKNRAASAIISAASPQGAPAAMPPACSADT